MLTIESDFMLGKLLQQQKPADNETNLKIHKK